MTKFDRSTIRAMSADMEKDLKAFAEKYGVVVEMGNCRFSQTEAKFSIKVAQVSNEGIALSNDMQLLKAMYPNAVGVEFKTGPRSKNMILIGYNPRAKKYPLMVADASDPSKAVYKMSMADARNYLGKEAFA